MRRRCVLSQESMINLGGGWCGGGEKRRKRKVLALKDVAVVEGQETA